MTDIARTVWNLFPWCLFEIWCLRFGDCFIDMHEKIYRGIVASPGIVIGRAYLLNRRKVVVAGRRIEEVSVKDEVARFRKSLELSRNQLEDLKKRFSKGLGKSHLYILDTHIMLLDDKMLVDG